MHAQPRSIEDQQVNPFALEVALLVNQDKDADRMPYLVQQFYDTSN